MGQVGDEDEGRAYPDHATEVPHDQNDVQGDDDVDDEPEGTDSVPSTTAPTDEAGASRTGSSARPASRPSRGGAGRRPSTRTAAERSAAAKKAAATRAANARARAEAAAREAEAAAQSAVEAAEDAEEAVAQSDASGSDDQVVTEPREDEPTGEPVDERVDAEQVSKEDPEVPAESEAQGEPDIADDVEDDVETDAESETQTETEPDVELETEAVETEPEVDDQSVAPAAGTALVAKQAPSADRPVVVSITGLMKRYGSTVAVEGVDLEVRAGSLYGIVGPNGAGKTTTLSIATGLLRPDAGSVTILGEDVWQNPAAAKRALGVLPDRLRLFDRLTGAQLLYYSATLRGLDGATARKRSADLATAFGLHDALDRLVSDYSVGMTKKIALAAAIIHSPRVLVLDEPFESVDPVSAATVTEVLQRYVNGGGTVLLSSHSMDLIERICDSVAVIVDGHVLASGTVDQVRAGRSLEQRFIELAGGRAVTEGMEWLQSFSD